MSDATLLSEHGDMKKARERLRASISQKNHHLSTFRTGLYLGLAIPALADGVYRCTLLLLLLFVKVGRVLFGYKYSFPTGGQGQLAMGSFVICLCDVSDSVCICSARGYQYLGLESVSYKLSVHFR